MDQLFGDQPKLCCVLEMKFPLIWDMWWKYCFERC